MGNGGDVEINTASLEVINGAQISASTLGEGNSGNVIITATERAIFDGVDSNGFSSGAFSLVTEEGRGNGGNIEVNTTSLDITNGAKLSASTAGEGKAGNVIIFATERVGLDNALISSVSEGTGKAGDINIKTEENLEATRSRIIATTQSDNGGNINLEIDDLLLLRNNSNISTTAGLAGAGGDGGNITIAADFIVGVSTENSDITANAFNGRGGNINITTQGIYGLQFREQLTPLSDITASSEFGLDGEFQLELLTNVNPDQGLTELPNNLVDATELIDRSCEPGGAASKRSFYIIGRGGLPYRPGDLSISEYTLGTVRSLPSTNTTNAISHSAPRDAVEVTPRQIVEATDWVRGENGQVTLVARGTQQNPWLKSPSCAASS